MRKLCKCEDSDAKEEDECEKVFDYVSDGKEEEEHADGEGLMMPRRRRVITQVKRVGI